MGLPRFVRNDKKETDKIVENLGKSGKMVENLDKVERLDVYYLPIERKVKVSKVPGSKRTVRIRKCRGGVYPRPIFNFSSVVAGHDSVEAMTGSFWD
jgi:hypothetical protein